MNTKLLKKIRRKYRYKVGKRSLYILFKKTGFWYADFDIEMSRLTTTFFDLLNEVDRIRPFSWEWRMQRKAWKKDDEIRERRRQKYLK